MSTKELLAVTFGLYKGFGAALSALKDAGITPDKLKRSDANDIAVACFAALSVDVDTFESILNDEDEDQ